jgi:hypothetical protein
VCCEFKNYKPCSPQNSRTAKGKNRLNGQRAVVALLCINKINLSSISLVFLLLRKKPFEGEKSIREVVIFM